MIKISEEARFNVRLYWNRGFDNNYVRGYLAGLVNGAEDSYSTDSKIINRLGRLVHHDSIRGPLR